MDSVLFLQSEVRDPFAIYSRMLVRNPLYYDDSNKIWAAYSYDYCSEVLSASQSVIPRFKTLASEDKVTSPIFNNLVRLSNGNNHDSAREAVKILKGELKNPNVPSLIQQLIGEPRLPFSINWVNNIAKKLPALSLLQDFNLPAQHINEILNEVETLTRLMTPITDSSELQSVVNAITKVKEAINDSMNVIAQNNPLVRLDMLISNFIGMLIQSFDAGRGLLSNSLIQLIEQINNGQPRPESYFAFVRESARINPTVHNTRRILTRDLRLGNHLIRKDEPVLVVLAAANLDPNKFKSPRTFDFHRKIEGLSFGKGIHHCIAEHYILGVTASVLEYLHNKYQKLEIAEKEFSFEPRINVRLPKDITLLIT